MCIKNVFIITLITLYLKQFKHFIILIRLSPFARHFVTSNRGLDIRPWNPVRCHYLSVRVRGELE